MKANYEIREMIREAGLFGYQVADAMGMQDSNFSKLLRKELPEEKRRRVIKVISDLKEGKKNAV